MSNQVDLPVKEDPDSFIAEFETMDLSKLKDKTYLVAVSREDRNGPKFVCSTSRGPYDFYEMCEEVGVMWRDHQHHAKVYILERDRNARVRFLDHNTADYIECHYADIVTEGLLEGVFDEQKVYTCQANIKEDDGEDDPRSKTKKTEVESDQDATQ
jgi:hypothetical protein